MRPLPPEGFEILERLDQRRRMDVSHFNLLLVSPVCY